MEEDGYDILFKIILVGDTSVGKTNIINKYIKNEFHDDLNATIGVEFSHKQFTVDNHKIKAQIWDTAGQERYKAITRAYYKGAKGAFIVYDITRKETFDNIDKWRNELINSCNQEVTIMLIGNKCDLEEQRQINTEQGEEKAKSFGFSFLETSAYSGENLEKGFEMLIKEIYQKYKVEQKGNDLYDLERPGELTGMGQRMHYLLGLRNRERYITNFKFLSEKFDPHEILIYSSSFNRTLNSVGSQIQGLYPQYMELGERITEDQITRAKPRVALSNNITEHEKSLGERALPNYMVVAPIRMINHNEKKIIIYDIPKCLFRRDEWREKNYNSLDSLKNIVKKFNDEYVDKIKKYYKKDQNYDIHFVDNFCDAFIAGYTEGKDMKIIKESGVDQTSLLNYCYNFSALNFRDWISGDKDRTLATMEVSKQMREFIYYMKKRVDADIAGEDIAKKLEDYSRPKMMMISAHDSTVSTYEMFFAKIFNNNDAISFYRYPYFATQIALEVVTDGSVDSKTKTYSDYIINYYFNDELVFNRTMEEFIKAVEPALWSDEKIDEYCHFVEKEEKEDTGVYIYLTITFSCLSAILLIILVILIIKMAKNKSVIDKGGVLLNSYDQN